MATQAPTDAEKECHSMEGPFPSITLARPSTGQNPGSQHFLSAPHSVWSGARKRFCVSGPQVSHL